MVGLYSRASAVAGWDLHGRTSGLAGCAYRKVARLRQSLYPYDHAVSCWKAAG